jgi:hypothetical protein
MALDKQTIQTYQYKSIYLDEVFLGRIWPYLSGCVSQSIVILVLLFTVWWVNGSLGVLTETNQINSIIFISIGLNIFYFGGLLILELYTGRLTLYLFFMSIAPLQIKNVSFRELNDFANTEERFGTQFGVPLGMCFLNILVFIIPYLLGVEWKTALLNSILFVLPFHIGFLTIYIVRTGIELILLNLRYISSIRERI